MARSPLTPAFDLPTFFLLRTPMLPNDLLVDWSAGLTAASAGATGNDLDEAIAKDREVLRARLSKLAARPEIREALFVASPSLEASLEAWRAHPDSERGQKVERTLVRYFQRMSTRSTPFGLFAGTSIGGIGHRTRLRLAEAALYVRHTRPDMDYLGSLVAVLNEDRGLRSVAKFRPNSSLHLNGGQWRYVASRFDGRSRDYALASVSPTPHLEQTLTRAALGERLEVLAAALVADDPEITPAESTEYLDALVSAQILVSELELGATGEEPLNQILGQLEMLHGCDVTDRARSVLGQLRTELEELDRRPPGSAPADYRHIAAKLEPLPVAVDLPRLFQVDLSKPVVEAELGPSVLAALQEGLHALHALAIHRGARPLDRFCEAFVARYERREVPFEEVLDEDSGVGFDRGDGLDAEGSPLLEGLVLPPSPDAEQVTNTPRDRLLLGKVLEAARARSSAISLTADELSGLGPPPRPLPDALSVLATIGAESAEALDRGQFTVYVESISGPPGVRMMSRFSHGDNDLRTLIEAHLRAEEALRPDAVFAELTHLPGGRVGNILSRPCLRPFEIPYLARSSVDGEHRIPLSDLLVSVRDGRVVLRSRRLGREVIPRNTTAHLTRHSLRPYRFLSDVAGQDVWTGSDFDWGALSSAPYLPRVCIGRTVLAPARWRVEEGDLSRWRAMTGADRFRSLQEFRSRVGLPRRVLLRDFDNALPVDFDNVLSLDAFVSLVGSRKDALLVEQLFDAESLVVEGPEGRFHHEINVPLTRRPVKSGETQRTELAKASIATAPTKGARLFAPGSEWLYLKVYCGAASLDRVLRVLRPTIRRALDDRAADRFFFLRYGDPDWHVRLRFRGVPATLQGRVLPALHEALLPLLANGLVWRIGVDSYAPEVERYGGFEGVAIAEAIFQADSLATLELLELLEGDDAAEARWQMCFAGSDSLLQDLGLTLEARASVLRGLRARYAQEFRGGTALERQLSERFRARRTRLDELLNPELHDDDPYAPGLALWRERSVALRPLAESLRHGIARGSIGHSIETLAASFVHMHTNRILRSAARAQELVLYDFLGRSYDSRLARARSSHGAA